MDFLLSELPLLPLPPLSDKLKDLLFMEALLLMLLWSMVNASPFSFSTGSCWSEARFLMLLLLSSRLLKVPISLASASARAASLDKKMFSSLVLLSSLLLVVAAGVGEMMGGSVLRVLIMSCRLSTVISSLRVCSPTKLLLFLLLLLLLLAFRSEFVDLDEETTISEFTVERDLWWRGEGIMETGCLFLLLLSNWLALRPWNVRRLSEKLLDGIYKQW